MNLNLETDIEEEIKKCNELLTKYAQLEQQAKKIHFVTIKEFAEMRGCSIATAQAIFNLPDLAVEDFGKEKVVSLEALRNFYMKKHKKSDYE